MSNIRYIDVQVSEYGETYAYASVESAFIDCVAWFSPSKFSDTSRLYVSIKTDEKLVRYHYKNVPLEIWRKVVNAVSVGKAYNELVKDQYEYSMI